MDNDIEEKYEKLLSHIIYHFQLEYGYLPLEKKDMLQEGYMAMIQAYNTFNEDLDTKFITYAVNCVKNRYRDLFKKKNIDLETLAYEYEIKKKRNWYLLDIIPKREERILNRLITKETKNELRKAIFKNLNDEDRMIICSLYGIKTKKMTQEQLAKKLGHTQSYIAKRHNKILNLIKKDLEY